ncbi:hypothetical protein [Kingella oralis]|uniref:hypothetical protein n=1 Tax=Kingella oralis TaxID=505 RepID=UPI0034E519F3
MNEQFKFGDRVARKNATPDYDKAFIVISAKDNGEICVFSSISKLPFDVQAKDYQLVPHPDTVRLNWLIETCRGIDNNADTTYLDGTPFPQYSVINSGTDRASNWYGVDGGDHDDPRQAIDNAMKQEQQK